MSFKEEKLTSKEIFNGKIMRLYVDDVLLPDGGVSKREYVRHCGGSAALFIKDGCVALVRQYRYVYGREIYEIPAGKIDAGESPEDAAARELAEETGYCADELEKLAQIYPSPGYTDEVIHIYAVKSAHYVGERHDEGEFLSCEFIPLPKVMEMAESGEISDAKTVCALYKYIASA